MENIVVKFNNNFEVAEEYSTVPFTINKEKRIVRICDDRDLYLGNLIESDLALFGKEVGPEISIVAMFYWPKHELVELRYSTPDGKVYDGVGAMIEHVDENYYTLVVLSAGLRNLKY